MAAQINSFQQSVANFAPSILVCCLLGYNSSSNLSTSWLVLTASAGFAPLVELPLVIAIKTGFLLTQLVCLFVWSAVGDVLATYTGTGICSRLCATRFLAATVAILVAIAGATWIAIARVECPEAAAAQELASQVDAVATYNRGVCFAWCHNCEEVSSLAKSGMCGVKNQTTAFTSAAIAASESEALWCHHAISTHTFEPHNATNSTTGTVTTSGGSGGGTAPFAALLESACPLSSNWKWNVQLQATANVGVVLVLAYDAVSLWRNMPASNRNPRVMDEHNVLLRV